MGSTSGKERYDVPTLSPIRNLVKTGRFKQALKEFESYYTSSTNVEALVLESICRYRLGDESVLDNQRSGHGDELTPELQALMFRHEVLGHIAARRFDKALDMLERDPSDKDERQALELLRSALSTLRQGQRDLNKVFVLKPRTERRGIVPRQEVRAQYLRAAHGDCLGAFVRTNTPDEGMSLTDILVKYMMMLIEFSFSDAERSNQLIRTVQAELGTVDAQFKKDLPSLRGHKLFHNYPTF